MWMSQKPLTPYFYPRPPRGGRRWGYSMMSKRISISIHALREEGDHRSGVSSRAYIISIHALREEGDIVAASFDWNSIISIHALREEGDHSTAAAPGCPGYFYPRPPRGGRLEDEQTLLCYGLFLSTPSARRATQKAPAWRFVYSISIHALREEGDQSDELSVAVKSDFYPRPPRGGRPTNLAAFADREIFLSTPSARRATLPF